MRCLQYRNDASYGFWRRFNARNDSHVLKTLYMVETAVHEMMLQVRPGLTVLFHILCCTDLGNVAMRVGDCPP